MTLRQLYEEGRDYLSKHGVPEAELSARLLLCEAFSMSAGEYLFSCERELSGQSPVSGKDDAVAFPEKEKNAVNYAVTKEIKQVVYAPGSLTRLSVAVAVNKILTETEEEDIKNLVIAAAGMDISRGDVVNVSSLKFMGIDKAEPIHKAGGLDKKAEPCYPGMGKFPEVQCFLASV